MEKYLDVIYLHFIFWISLITICSACGDSDDDNNPCWYELWYIWFVLSLFVIVFIILIILYVKHRAKERSRIRRIPQTRRHNTVAVSPMRPPAYTEPSHKPPTYDEAISQHYTAPPGVIPGYNENHRPRQNMQVSTIGQNRHSSTMPPTAPMTPNPQPPPYQAHIGGGPT